jgi:hypothetical protein
MSPALLLAPPVGNFVPPQWGPLELPAVDGQPAIMYQSEKTMLSC